MPTLSDINSCKLSIRCTSAVCMHGLVASTNSSKFYLSNPSSSIIRTSLARITVHIINREILLFGNAKEILKYDLMLQYLHHRSYNSFLQCKYYTPCKVLYTHQRDCNHCQTSSSVQYISYTAISTTTVDTAVYALAAQHTLVLH